MTDNRMTKWSMISSRITNIKMIYSRMSNIRMTFSRITFSRMTHIMTNIKMRSSIMSTTIITFSRMTNRMTNIKMMYSRMPKSKMIQSRTTFCGSITRRSVLSQMTLSRITLSKWHSREWHFPDCHSPKESIHINTVEKSFRRVSTCWMSLDSMLWRQLDGYLPFYFWQICKKALSLFFSTNFDFVHGKLFLFRGKYYKTYLRWEKDIFISKNWPCLIFGG